MSSFDADALERAAKFARELEGTKNVTAYIEISKREQQVKLTDAQKEIEKAKADAARMSAEAERIRWEEQRKTIKFNKDQQLVRPHRRCVPRARRARTRRLE